MIKLIQRLVDVVDVVIVARGDELFDDHGVSDGKSIQLSAGLKQPRGLPPRVSARPHCRRELIVAYIFSVPRFTVLLQKLLWIIVVSEAAASEVAPHYYNAKSGIRQGFEAKYPMGLTRATRYCFLQRRLPRRSLIASLAPMSVNRSRSDAFAWALVNLEAERYPPP